MQCSELVFHAIVHLFWLVLRKENLASYCFELSSMRQQMNASEPMLIVA